MQDERITRWDNRGSVPWAVVGKAAGLLHF